MRADVQSQWIRRYVRDSLALSMRQSLFLPFAVLLVARVSIVSARSGLASNAHGNRIDEASNTLFPLNIFKKYPDVKFDDYARADDTRICFEQLQLLVDGLMTGTNDTIWAVKMADASSKIPSGMLMGNRVDLGMYDECMAIRATDEDGDEVGGRHCMYSAVAIVGQAEVTEFLSICVPATCGPEEVQIFLNVIINTIESMMHVSIPIETKGVTCSPVLTPDWTAGGIATLSIFGLLLLFLVICTIFDAIVRCFQWNLSKDSGLTMIRGFSMYSSALRICSMKTSAETLPALQGLRFFSMCWVILGHEYAISVAATINSAEMLEWLMKWDSLYMLIAPFAVDTFFTMSGFLISYLFLKEMSTGRRFNIFGYYIHRYLRLTPAFGAMILLAIFIIPRLGSGALWDTVMTMSTTSCRNKWWSMLLYVHNYVEKDDRLCLAHTWYLAVEMQFFAISPLILYPLSKKPRIGLCILSLFFFAAVATPTIIANKNEYSSALLSPKDLKRSIITLSKFYMETHIRAAPWVIGLFFGYLTFTQKGLASRATKWIGWFLATAAFCFCIFSSRKFQEEDYTYEPVWETFYTAVARPLWGFGVSWVIYAAARGFGGPVTTILSLPIFHPFSRISYCIYLVHFMVEVMKISATRVPRYFSDFSVFNYFLSDFVLSVIVGFFFSLIFESPILILEKILTRRVKPETQILREEPMDRNVETGIENPGLSAT